jgi:hypothetical protein
MTVSEKRVSLQLARVNINDTERNIGPSCNFFALKWPLNKILEKTAFDLKMFVPIHYYYYYFGKFVEIWYSGIYVINLLFAVNNT